MKGDILQAEREYLAQLLEAIQRCTYFLSASDKKVPWPLNGKDLEVRKKDEGLFESLAAINERFAKLQDTLGAAMRHAALLLADFTPPKSAKTLASTGLEGDIGFQVGGYMLTSNKRSICSCSGVGVLF